MHRSGPAAVAHGAWCPSGRGGAPVRDPRDLPAEMCVTRSARAKDAWGMHKLFPVLLSDVRDA